MTGQSVPGDKAECFVFLSENSVYPAMVSVVFEKYLDYGQSRQISFFEDISSLPLSHKK